MLSNNYGSPAMPSETEKRAYSIEEFSERWGWGRNTTYNLIASGELGSIKAGRRRLITAEQEEEFRKRKEAESA